MSNVMFPSTLPSPINSVTANARNFTVQDSLRYGRRTYRLENDSELTVIDLSYNFNQEQFTVFRTFYESNKTNAFTITLGNVIHTARMLDGYRLSAASNDVKYVEVNLRINSLSSITISERNIVDNSEFASFLACVAMAQRLLLDWIYYMP